MGRLQKAQAVGSLHENCDKQTLAEADTAPSLLNSRLGHESEESRREASFSTGHMCLRDACCSLHTDAQAFFCRLLPDVFWKLEEM